MHLRILLVDDHEIVRLGLRALLSRYPYFDVVGEAGDANEALELTERLQPDIVVMDIRLPGRNGIEATRAIVEQRPETKVIMLTSHADDDILIEAINAGASGYVLKQIGSDDLVHALEMVGRGESMLDPTLTQKLFRRVRQDARKAEDEFFAALSDQEINILALITEGLTNREIAERVFLSEKTVRNYVERDPGKIRSQLTGRSRRLCRPPPYPEPCSKRSGLSLPTGHMTSGKTPLSALPIPSLFDVN